jgi:H+/Cl- antiporter ClcA
MLLFELTRDYDVVLPLVASAGVAALVVELLGPKPERGDRRDAGE